MNVSATYPAANVTYEVRGDLGRLATGVTKITTCGDSDRPRGLP